MTNNQIEAERVLLKPQRYEFSYRNDFNDTYSAERDDDADGRYVLIEDVQEAIDYWNRRTTPPAQGESVSIPQNADQAQLMANLGLEYLKHHAPERLKKQGESALPELPEPVRMSSDQSYLGYTADQMRAYGQACRAQVSDADKVDAWLPIETAPKDTALLLYCHGCYELGHFNTALERWVDCNRHSPLKPTHWQPLPPPPAVQAQAGEGEKA